MLTIALVSILVPAAAVGIHLASRSAMVQRLTDSRGIALQTVIIMVVLLAIAGAVAGVLLTRGQEAVTNLEQQDIEERPTNPSTINNRVDCDRWNYNWDEDLTTCS